MNDQVVETTSQGWLSRIVESIKAVVVGLALFVVSFPLLWWNEGRAVQTFQSLTEGAGAVVSVANDKVEPGREGQLVHVSGRASTDEVLRDPTFGVSANALRLAREAEMYQWVEHVKTETKKKAGGGEETTKTYTYEREWKTSHVDSSDFKERAGHTNPKGMPATSDSWQAERVLLGAFQLAGEQVGRIDAEEHLEVTSDMLAPAAKPAAVAKAPKGKKGKKPKTAKAAKAATGPAHTIVRGGIYLGKNSDEPAVGDVRLSFTKVPPTIVSVVAAQQGQSFAAYQTKAGDALSLLEVGEHTAAGMFEEAQSDNAVLTWILRLVGFALMAIGLYVLFKPLAVVADVLPLLGDVLRMGLGFIAVSLALPFSLLTIAMAWLFYRPVLGVILLVSGVLALTLVKVTAMKKKAAALAPAMQPPAPPPQAAAAG
jgi:hypothetical protein